MTHTYAFVGLTPSERSLLESIFALDADVDPGEALVAVRLGESEDGADLLIANGDDLTVVEKLHASYPNALLVLVGQPPGAQNVRWPVMRRPLELHGAVNVLSELDWPETVQRRTPVPRRAAAPSQGPSQARAGDDSIPSSQPPSTGSPSESMSSAFAPTTVTAPLVAANKPHPDAPLSARKAWAVSEVGSVGQLPASAPPPRPSAPSAQRPSQPLAQQPLPPDASLQQRRPADILVVLGRRNGDIPSLARGLSRMGYAVKAVASADEALAEMARHPSKCVFLDQPSLGGQLLPLARALNAMRSTPEQPPHLAVVARAGSAFDRLRARMAGCVWMRVPVDRERLTAYLERRGLPRPDAGAA